jgi:hypothetical protein
LNVCIAGGRNYKFTPADIAWLDELSAEHGFQHVIVGGATGADHEAAKWWRSRNCGDLVWTYEADWKRYGKMAGPERNRRMAAKADMVILFPGGRGTLSMAMAARAADKPILYRVPPPPDYVEPDDDDLEGR